MSKAQESDQERAESLEEEIDDLEDAMRDARKLLERLKRERNSLALQEVMSGDRVHRMARILRAGFSFKPRILQSLVNNKDRWVSASEIRDLAHLSGSDSRRQYCDVRGVLEQFVRWGIVEKSPIKRDGKYLITKFGESVMSRFFEYGDHND